MKAKVIQTEIGIEKRCTSCREYWPADPEFYYVDRASHDGLTSVCKACFKERYQTTKPSLTLVPENS